MNTGMQDAANLGWKVAAVLHGWAPDDLLDSYHSERHPVGRAVLRGSGALLRLALARSWITRAARGVLRYAVGPLGLMPSGAARAVSGIGIAYPRPPHQHELTGQRAPDAGLSDGPDGSGRLYEALRGGRFVLVTRDGRRVPTGWADRVDSAEARDIPTAAMLVRPDGYIAWAGDDDTTQAPWGGVPEALTHWCGAPRIRS